MAKDVITRFKADVGNYDANIAKARRQLEGFKKDNLSAGGVIKQLSSSLVGAAAKFASIGAAASAAMKVAKDAFFQSEGNIDEWGRTVDGAKGAYSTFLNTLNSGNWSNFFTNLSTAVNGARDLYDALDRLGSIKANNQAAISIIQQQISQLRLAKQNGENVDAQLQQATEKLRALQNQSVNAGLTAGNMSIRNTLRNRVNAANTTGVNIGEGTFIQLAYELEHSGQAVFDSMKKTFDDLSKKATIETTTAYTNRNGTYYQTSTIVDINRLTDEEQKQYLVAKAITEGETEIQKGLSIYAQAIQEGTSAAREEFKNNRYSLTGGSGKGGSGDTKKEEYIPLAGSIDEQIAKVKELQDAFNKTADQSIRGQLITAIDEATRHLEFMQGKGVEPLTANTGSLSSHLGLPDVGNMKITDEDIEKLNKIANAGQAAETSWDSAMGAVSGLGSALAAIEDPAVKVLGIIAEAIATVALTFAKSLKGTVTPWDWIAGAAAGTATMISTIAAIKSATAGSFAEGGIVPGNNHNDGLIANVSSGELILNKSQQNNIAALLRQQNSENKAYQPSYVSGEQIWVAMNRYLKRSGQGEVLTWKS